MATLAEIRAKLQQQESRGKGGSTGGDNTIYAHWNIPEGTTSRVRFLPDGNEKNSFFWVERAMIKLPFAGIKGQADSKPVVVQVPCMEMYGEACPVLAEVRPWFKDPGLEEMGRKYWKKKSYLFQGFVRENALSDDKTPENPIRRFVISPQIFNIIKAALMDPEMENLPTDYAAGLDFQIVKTSKGGYSDYSTSKWSRKESALTAEEATAIEEHGLYNLADFLPKKPGEVELKIITEMFEASVDGQPYDPDRWAQYYKPAGFNAGNGTSGSDDDGDAPFAGAKSIAAKPAAKPAVVESSEDDEGAAAEASAPVAAAKPASQKAEDILALIRNRKQS
ncbi:MAG TPA: hypothetical protein VFM18_19345 [Methanosarcina sp.]|nr:hypothetical protein [Methanosarcina sp.]